MSIADRGIDFGISLTKNVLGGAVAALLLQRPVKEGLLVGVSATFAVSVMPHVQSACALNPRREHMHTAMHNITYFALSLLTVYYAAPLFKCPMSFRQIFVYSLLGSGVLNFIFNTAPTPIHQRIWFPMCPCQEAGTAKKPKTVKQD